MLVRLPKYSGAAKRTTLERWWFVKTVSAAGYDPVAVGAHIEIESNRTWSPAVRGPAGTFTDPPGYPIGLLQFAPSTARRLGTTTEKMQRMSFLEQLPFVPRYYALFGDPARFQRPADYYAAGFGTGVGAPDTYVVAATGTPAYAANSGLDRNKDGSITIGEFSDLMNQTIQGAKSRGEWVIDTELSTVSPWDTLTAWQLEMLRAWSFWP